MNFKHVKNFKSQIFCAFTTKVNAISALARFIASVNEQWKCNCPLTVNAIVGK